jgi:predicted AAA+ superfamily ATPase
MVRNIASFARFLDVAAFSNGEIVNFSNIAADCGVSAPTIRSHFQILEETLTGRFLPSFQKRPKRRVIQAPKFYFFDVGLANYLMKRTNIEYGSEDFILGDHEVAVEVKATTLAHPRHFSGLNSFSEEYTVKHKILVTNDINPRQVNDIMILPWRVFLERLWAGELIS